MSERKGNTAGGVLVEAAVGFILLSFLLAFVLSIIQFAAAYHTMSQSLRTCNSVNMYRNTPSPLAYNQTENDYHNFSYPSQATYEACINNPNVYPDCIHRVVHWRVRQHLISNKPNIYNVTIGTFWDTFDVEELYVVVTAHYDSGLFFVNHEMSVASVADPCIAPSPSPSVSASSSPTASSSVPVPTVAPSTSPSPAASSSPSPVASSSPSPVASSSPSPVASASAGASATPTPTPLGSSPTPTPTPTLAGGTGNCWCDEGAGGWVCCGGICDEFTGCDVPADPSTCDKPVPPPYPGSVACVSIGI